MRMKRKASPWAPSPGKNRGYPGGPGRPKLREWRNGRRAGLRNQFLRSVGSTPISRTIYNGQFRSDACKSASDRPFPGFSDLNFSRKTKDRLTVFSGTVGTRTHTFPQKQKAPFLIGHSFKKGAFFVSPKIWRPPGRALPGKDAFI